MRTDETTLDLTGGPARFRNLGTLHDETAEDVNPDVWAHARGEEFATEWAVERTDETIVLLETFRRAGDHVERDGVPIAFDVDQGQSTEEWAAGYAARNPEGKVAAARRFFEE